MASDSRHMDEVLPDFVSGHLGQEDRDKVTAHLEVCPDCRSILSTMKSLVNQAGVGSVSSERHHMDDDLLWQYYNKRSTMSGSLRARVEVHIGHCYDCSSALDLLKGLEQDLTQGIREPVADKFGFVSHLGNLIRNPVFAYALLILSIYPALSWITSNPSREPNAASTTLPERTFRLSPQLRSVAGPVRVLRSDRTAAVLLQIPFYALMDEKNYSVALDDADGKSAHDLRSSITIGADGMILVLLDTSPLADGEYVLTLVEADKSRVGSATTTNYLFDLQTGQ